MALNKKRAAEHAPKRLKRPTRGSRSTGRPKTPRPASKDELAVMSLFEYRYPADLCQIYSEIDAHVKSAESEFAPSTSSMLLSFFDTAVRDKSGAKLRKLADMIESGPGRNKIWDVIVNSLEQGRAVRSESGEITAETRPATAEEVVEDVVVFCRSELRREPEDSFDSLVQITRKLAKKFNLPIADKRKLPGYTRPIVRQETAGFKGYMPTTHHSDLEP